MSKSQRIAFAAIAVFAVVRAVTVSANPSADDNRSTQEIAAAQSCRDDGKIAQSTEPASLKADPLYGLDNAEKPFGLDADQDNDALASLKTTSGPSMAAAVFEGKPFAGRQLCA